MDYVKYLKWILPFMPLTLGVEGDGDGGGDDENKGETVSKADFEKVSGERDKFQKDLDDARAEIFTPEYMAYLDKKDKPAEEERKKEEQIPDDKFEKMSKKEIFELATKTATENFRKTLDADKNTAKTQTEAAKNREVARFAKENPDFEKFRPAMYGLSLKAENKDLGLAELYKKSKEYVVSLQTEPTEDEKKKGRSMDGMKPGQSSGTYGFDKKVDGDTAAKEAAEETLETLGPLPSA